MKIILGWSFRARPNIPLINLLLSPYNLLAKVETAILMNVAPDYFARARASMVLPQPGGPYKRTPFGAESSEEEVKSSGKTRG